LYYEYKKSKNHYLRNAIKCISFEVGDAPTETCVSYN